jgi:hypothetical protein
MKSMILLSFLLLVVSPLAEDLRYSASYHGNDLPEKDVPRWTSKGNLADPKLSDGILSVASEGANKRLFYILDPKSGAWDMTSGLATVEFRLRCHSDDAEDEVFRVQFSDGKQIWRAVFFNQRCNGAKAKTDDWDTYRLTVKDGKLQISSELQGVMASGIAGSPGDDEPFLLFGTFKNSPNDAIRGWDLDFIRWTNQEAIMADAKP